MLYFYIGLGIYIVAISIVAVITTIKDKEAAKKNAWRIKESTLLLICALGGSVAMLLTMRSYRHKTKHAKFMVGIPLIIILQIAFVALIIYLALR